MVLNYDHHINSDFMNNQLKQNFQRLLKILFIVINVFLSTLGILTLIAIYNYNFTQNGFRSNYMFALAEKAISDAWPIVENNYNELTKGNRRMGELRIQFRGNQLNESTIDVYPYFNKITGIVYTGGKRYMVAIDKETLKMTLEESRYNWDWRWYDWLGIELGILDKRVRQAQEERLKKMINAPLPDRTKAD